MARRGRPAFPRQGRAPDASSRVDKGVPALAGPGRRRSSSQHAPYLVDPADLPIFQTMVSTSFPLNSDRRPRRIYLAYQQFFRVNNVA